MKLRKGRDTDGSNSPGSAVKDRSIIKRRDVLKTSAAIASGGGVVSHGGVGMVSASSACTDSGSYDWQSNYVWTHDDATSADNYDCDHLPDYYKIEHTSSLMYLGSCEMNNRWIHDFITTGHAEHFTRTYCDDTWTRSRGIGRHRASFDRNYSFLNFDTRADEWVKAHPDMDGTGDEPSAWMDWAYTAMSVAVGYHSWVAGTAMSLAAVYLDHVGDTPSTNYTLTYDWDYGDPISAEPCGSHFIWQDVQSDYDAPDDVDFDYIDEAWGRYPNYTNIHYNVQFYDADPPEDGCGSTSSLETTNGSCTTNADVDNAPAVGEQINNSKGETVEVKAVDNTVVSRQGSDPMKIDPKRLSPNLRQKVDSDEPVTYREFPMKITKTKIEGEVLD